jgi:hypothetical protein
MFFRNPVKILSCDGKVFVLGFPAMHEALTDYVSCGSLLPLL